MNAEFTKGAHLAGANSSLNLHSGRVQEGYSSRHLAVRPRLPMGADITVPPTADEMAHAAMLELDNAASKLEVAVFDSLWSRTTAHFGEHRVFKAAFTKFDTDGTGSVDFKEFTAALESLGLHTAENGLAGQGGVPQNVVRQLFSRYDKDGSGEVDYAEFYDKLLKVKDANHSISRIGASG